MSELTLFFINKNDIYAKPEPFLAQTSMKFYELVIVVAKKFMLRVDEIAVATQNGTVFTATELNYPVDTIVSLYGTVFEIISRGVVG